MRVGSACRFRGSGRPPLWPRRVPRLAATGRAAASDRDGQDFYLWMCVRRFSTDCARSMPVTTVAGGEGGVFRVALCRAMYGPGALECEAASGAHCAAHDRGHINRTPGSRPDANPTEPRRT